MKSTVAQLVVTVLLIVLAFCSGCAGSRVSLTRVAGEPVITVEFCADPIYRYTDKTIDTKEVR
jgi:hypothetical protein